MIKNTSKKILILSISLLFGILLISGVSAFDWNLNCDLCDFDFGCSNCCDPSGETCDNGNHCCEPYPEPECCSDEDCDDDYYSNDYCSGDDVYKDFHDFFCLFGECEEEIIPELVEECSYMCVSGECIDEPEPICGNSIEEEGEQCDDGNTDNYDGCSSICQLEQYECYSDETCGEDVYSNNYCSEGNSYKDFHDFSCIEGSCTEDIIPELVEECSYMCVEGECIDEPDPECCEDSDCDDDYYSDKYCSNGDVYWDFYDYFCLDDECDFNIIKTLFDICDSDEDCEDGECVEEEDNHGHRKRNKCCYDRQCGEEDIYYTYQECDIEFGEYDDFEDSYYNPQQNFNVESLGQEIIGIKTTQESNSIKHNNFWLYFLLIGAIVLILLILISLLVRK